MARRKSRRRKRSQRDASRITESGRLLRSQDFRHVEDNRRFRYDRIGYGLSIFGRPAEVRATRKTKTKPSRFHLAYSRLEYVDPRRVITCKRRNNRRQTLFARRIIGRGKGGARFRKRRMTERSRIRC